jgi:predicted MPP superfamily phosphohydrolase
MTHAAPPEPANPPPDSFSRRDFFRRLAVYAAVPIAGGIYATQIEPFWPVFTELSIPIPGLPKSFDGFRIAQLSDLHAGRAPFPYIQKVTAKVQQLKPDLLAVTGDLVHHTRDWVKPISALLGDMKIPAIVSYGNHDYGVFRGDDDTADADLPQVMEAELTRNGCTVLRNQSTKIEHPDGRLWIVGLDDWWFGDFSPSRAFAGVPKDESVIAFSHNPDTAEQLDLHRPNLILAGHTHGGQVRLPGIGALYLNTANHRFDQGMFHLKHSTLDVSRGIGYVRKVRFYCRPEIPIFTLTAS